MNGEHPCNICTNKLCEEPETYGDCVWERVYSTSFSCNNYDCMLNYEGSCIGSFYGRCGCQEQEGGDGMRDILFRGKRLDNGEWVYGDLFLSDTDGGAYILAGSRIVTIDWEIDPSTVGQYTGLLDKHGKRIFEGDIMAFVAYGFDYVGSVEIVDGNASVMCKHASPFLDQAVSKHGAYIIGNIHDNPELLEGGASE